MNDNINSVLGEMLSSNTKDFNKKVSKIYFTSLKRNKLNSYSQEDIEVLAESLKTEGQLVPLVVYEQDNAYIILSGHRRYSAFELLVNNEYYDKFNLEIDCFIIDKPKSKREEIESIVLYNSYRTKTKETTIKQVVLLGELYDSDENSNKGRKRDYIGHFLGISGRQVQKYLDELKGEKKPTSDVKRDNSTNGYKKIANSFNNINKILEEIEVEEVNKDEVRTFIESITTIKQRFEAMIEE